jgi:chemotaxis-related protein WspD
LAALLNIASQPAGQDASSPEAKASLLVLEEGPHLWVFPVDEVLGVRNSGEVNLEALPVTVSRSPQVLTRGLLTLDGKKVGLLDEGLLFHHLRKQMAQ